MKKLVLLMLLAGCEACATLPTLEVPDTRPISEFEMDFWVRDSIGKMYVGAVAEEKERVMCLWGRFEVTQTELPNYKAPKYFLVVFDSVSPARTGKATATTVEIPEGKPCEDGALGTIHTHLSQGGHSTQDLYLFLITYDHVVSFVVDGVGQTVDGLPAARLHYVTRQGARGTWILPLWEEP